MKSGLFSVRLSPSISWEGTATEEQMNYTFAIFFTCHPHTINMMVIFWEESLWHHRWPPCSLFLSPSHTHTHTHRHYYCSLISNPWENAAAVCTGKLGITVNLLCIKSTRSDNDSLQVRASCLALYSSLTEGKCQGCYPALYPPPLFLPLSLLHPGHCQIKLSGWSRKTIDTGGWAQTNRRVAGQRAQVSIPEGLHALKLLSPLSPVSSHI